MEGPDLSDDEASVSESQKSYEEDDEEGEVIEDEYMEEGDEEVDDEEISDEENETKAGGDSIPRKRKSVIRDEAVILIKNMTTLSGMHEDDWSNEVYEGIKKFISNPERLLLVIYYRHAKLYATGNFPVDPVRGLMFFIRVSKNIVTCENFFDVLIFQTVTNNVEGTILNIVKYIYAPIFFSTKSWPASVKNEFNDHLHEFLAQLTEISSKIYGNSELYVPLEGITIALEDATKPENADLIRRLESILTHWSRQFRVAVHDVNEKTRAALLTPIDEFEFWEYRWENLALLTVQMDSREVRHVIDFLTSAQSAYIMEFNKLLDETRFGVEEALSNLSYLQVLIEPCKRLQMVKCADEIPDHLPYLINLSRAIWLHSPYYNTPNRVTNLFRSISNQIVLLCKGFIKLSDIFKEKKTRIAIKALEDNILCCTKYLAIYSAMKDALKNSGSISWDIKQSALSPYVDTFVNRNSNLIEICQAMITFGRMDENVRVKKPLFGGTKGAELSAMVDTVEQRFVVILKKVIEHQDIILDVLSPTWNDEMVKFRAEIQHLELLLEHLLESVMAQVNTIDEGLYVLQGFFYYSRRPSLFSLFEKKTVVLWQMLLDDIQKLRQSLSGASLERQVQGPVFGGTALLIHLQVEHLLRNSQMLACAEWLPSVPLAIEAKAELDNVLHRAQSTIRTCYQKWSDSLEDDTLKLLDRSLVVRSTTMGGLLEVNIDPMIVHIANECRYWKQIGHALPHPAEHINNVWPKVRETYEGVLYVVLGYNKIVSAFSEQERLLFKEHLKRVDQKINIGMHRLKWDSDSNDYIFQCASQILKLQEFVDVYKTSLLKITILCEKMCDTKLLQIPQGVVFNLDDFESYTYKQMILGLVRIVNLYRRLVEHIDVIYEGFEECIEQSGVHWHHFILKLDKLMEEAILLCVQSVMETMLNSLGGEEGRIFEPAPFINVVIHLASFVKGLVSKKGIQFEPDIERIKEMADNFLDEIVEAFEVVPRIYKKLRMRGLSPHPFHMIIQNDAICQHYQKSMTQQVMKNVNLIQDYLENWAPYRYLWKTTKAEFLKKYADKNPSDVDWNTDISHFDQVTKIVMAEKGITSVHFTRLDAGPLKLGIVQQCLEWKDCLCDILQNKINDTILSILHYCEEQGKRVLQRPKDLKSLQKALEFFETVSDDVEEQEKQFSKIDDLFAVLEKQEVELNVELGNHRKMLPECWAKYLKVLTSAMEMLVEVKETFKVGLLEETDSYQKEITDLVELFRQAGPFSSAWNATDAVAYLNDIKSKIDHLQNAEFRIQNDLAIFEIVHPNNNELIELNSEVNFLANAWDIVLLWETIWDTFKNQNFFQLDVDDLEEKVMTCMKHLIRLAADLKEYDWDFADKPRDHSDAVRRCLPLFIDLKNPCLRQRHWNTIRNFVLTDFNEKSPEFTANAVLEMRLQDFADEINELSRGATMELSIENGLKNIRETWATLQVTLESYKDIKDLYRLKEVDDIIQTLEENQTMLTAMKGTKYVEPFIKEVDLWERSLSAVDEALELLLTVQRQWVYLENIFTGEDIRKQLPEETKIFGKLTETWRETTLMIHENTNALAISKISNLFPTLTAMTEELEEIQRALEVYLETKRNIFPRFYFISNDDLLEILGNSKKPELIQAHLKKLFDNIARLKMVKNGLHVEAVQMISADRECIDFSRPVICEGPVENWLRDVETVMRLTLKNELRSTRNALKKTLNKRTKWLKEQPGQMCITSSQIQWTTDCTKALLSCKVLDGRLPLRKLRSKMKRILESYSELLRSNLAKIQRLKVVALVTIEIHARDVVDAMYKAGCMDVSAFQWAAQLRFYWSKWGDNEDCTVRQTNTGFTYGYEYLGNSGRLAITPLTDRCYITLTTALHMYRGGSPKGPAGTGKTETVKDLGKALGCYVIVINCSEGLDYKSMARMFSGFAQTGAWGCFDEFNRINIEVLSVVAQQILSILSALSQKLHRFLFEGNEINLISTCGIFITMNPGYAGRTELPDNLKAMFRPIAMVVPDSALIAEITLFGEGFNDSRALAKKVVTLFSLCMQQLSKQDHYDFGLRGMVALLRHGGGKRRKLPHLPHEQVLLLAIRDMNLAKLTANDLILFNGIIQDLFPGVDPPAVENNDLFRAVKREMKRLNLHYTPLGLLETMSDSTITHCPYKPNVIVPWVQKVLQLYETKTSRHSVMIVGATGTGKTTTWKLLKAGMTALQGQGYEQVIEYPLNPKTLSLGELFGEFNLATGEWLDGVVSSIMRKVCAEETPDEKWVLFDGPVDAVWIENMNSAMDDNKILTLINSERIAMPEQVSFLFEVEDLCVASPATVSRCGMVYADYKDTTWKPYVQSWLNTIQSNLLVATLADLFTHILPKVLQFKKLHCKEIIPVHELACIRSLCRLLEIFCKKENGLDEKNPDTFSTMVKMWFLFSLIWSVCGTLDEASRQKMDAHIRELEGVFPTKSTIYEYFVDVHHRNFLHWETKLDDHWKYNPNAQFHQILVPTVDTIRYEFFVGTLLKTDNSPLIVGPVGTGKTSIIQNVLNGMSGGQNAILSMNLSAQTSAKSLQDVIEGRLEKRTKGVYCPVGGKRLLLFMDDFNMPAKEIYGSQPPLELLRHWLEYGFWYDRQKQTRKYVKDMVIIGGMGPPGGGRNPIPNRLVSKFHTIALTFPEEEQIIRIFTCMLQQHMASFRDEVKAMAEGVAEMTVALFSAMVENLLPTPNKSHYLFNLRDISRVFQGLLRSHKDYQNTGSKLLRLWIYEAFRVFYDRLVDEGDQQWFVNKLDEVLGNSFDVTFGALCPGKRTPIFGDFMNPHQVYEDLLDMNALRNFITEQLQEYNATPGIMKMRLVLFRDAIEHICRIVRVLSQPRGNMLLVGIGGSGKQSLEKLSLYICKYRSFEISVGRNYKVGEFREDLKLLYKQTGVDNKQVGFLLRDSQIVVEDFLEIINSMLSTGDAPNLFKSEELDEIRNNLTPAAEKQGFMLTSETVLGFLIERARGNLHILLSMTPSDEAFRHRLMKYPGLVSCTTLDWFQPWPEEALLEVAEHILQTCNFTETIFPVTLVKGEVENRQKVMITTVASIFSRSHRAAEVAATRMKNEMKRICYITPTGFLKVIDCYMSNLTDKRNIMKDQAKKLQSGLGRIEEARLSVASMTIELEKASVKVLQIQEECEQAMEVMSEKRQEADEQAKVVQIKSEKIEEEEAECKKLARIAQADLDEAMPAVEEALAALESLSKKDISELKSYGKPPPKVMMVMEAVCILKGVTPDWTESKRILGEQDFLKSLKEYDKDHIPEKVMKKIATYTSMRDFDPEEVEMVSFAARSLCMWVIAMEAYGKLWRVVGPKKANLEETLKSLRIKQAEVAKLQEQLKAVQDFIRQLNEEYQAKHKELDDLKSKAELLQLKLDRAAMLVDGLAEEKLRWEATVASCEEQLNNLPGDCLLPAVFLSYVGPFVSEYREILLREWGDIIDDYEEVAHSAGLKLLDFIVDPALVNDWNSLGLPSDEFSIQNGILVATSISWPIVIDPQSQCNKWIKNMERPNNLKVVDLEQADLLKTMEACIIEGLPVLLQNVYENIDPSLSAVINKSIITETGKSLMNFNEKYIVYNPNFRLYITTKLSNPHYSPELSAKTTIVNFAVKQEGLEAQLLGIVVRRERPELEELKASTLQTISVGRKTLLGLEAELLRLLYETEGSLLENEELFETLQISRVTSHNVKESVQMAMITEIEIEAARAEYLPCATRAALLFVALNDLHQVDPMYQFSLDSYLQLFQLSVEKSIKSQGVNDRIFYINDYHTYAVYKNTCRALFGDHKLLFAFYICMKILQAQGKVSMEEYMFLIKGGVVLRREGQKENPAPSWITETAWDNITELEKVPGMQRVVRSFQDSLKEWNAWYLSPCPEKISLPGGWETASDLTRLIFLRCLRDDRLTVAISEFVAKKLGRNFVEPPVLDISAVYEDSSPFVPLIFILSPGVDPTASLLHLANQMMMSQKLLTLSLGQGQAPIAARYIEQGIENGLWVFLANCHLSLSWMPTLDKIVEGFRARPNIHRNFRLWLSSTPHPDFPISILQDGLKMTTEPPYGLKGNLLRLYQSITEDVFSKCNRREKYQKLLFSLSFFHVVLLERKKFQELGWNVHYSFNDSDFEISEHILSMYLDEYQDTPWDALKYLIAEVSYGGHITDEWDRRLMMTYAQQCFSTDVLEVPTYRFSSLPIYYVPRDGPLDSYRDYILTLPSVDPPEAFGQHFNADINYLITEARILRNTLMSLQQQQATAVGGSTKEEKVLEVAEQLLAQLPDSIDVEAAEANMGRQPLDIVLLQEAERYNSLLKIVVTSLKEVQLGISGRIVMTQDAENTFACLFSASIPKQWLKVYSSIKPLGAWTRELCQRVEYLKHWADTTKPPILHWPAAFTFPTGFLTAVLQTAARSNAISVDLLSWEFTIINLDEASIEEAPGEGVYVRGLFLEGAAWDRRLSCLAEPQPMQLISQMPVIWFKPAEIAKKRTKGIYSCPSYYYPIRAGSFVVAIDLNRGAETSEFWTKRGTALLLTLSN